MKPHYCQAMRATDDELALAFESGMMTGVATVMEQFTDASMEDALDLAMMLSSRWREDPAVRAEAVGRIRAAWEDDAPELVRRIPFARRDGAGHADS